MSEKKDGGPAFPQVQVDMGNGPEDPAPFGMGGMTLRDYFAGCALTGLCSAHNQEGEWTGSTVTGDTAPEAYRLADAMLAERDK